MSLRGTYFCAFPKGLGLEVLVLHATAPPHPGHPARRRVSLPGRDRAGRLHGEGVRGGAQPRRAQNAPADVLGSSPSLARFLVCCALARGNFSEKSRFFLVLPKHFLEASLGSREIVLVFVRTPRCSRSPGSKFSPAPCSGRPARPRPRPHPRRAVTTPGTARRGGAEAPVGWSAPARAVAAQGPLGLAVLVPDRLPLVAPGPGPVPGLSLSRLR